MSECAAPIPYEQLVALWTGELAADIVDSIEEHLFGCDPCARTAQQLGALLAGLREYVPPVISHHHRDRLAASGLKLRHTTIDAEQPIQAVFTPDIDMLVHVLRGDLASAERVDVDLTGPDGTPQLQLVDVPFDRPHGEILIACQRHYEAWGDPIFQVHVYQGGQRRELRRYVIKHVWL